MKISLSREWPVLNGLLLAGSMIALRFPVYASLEHFSNNQGVQPWDNAFRTWCRWDCNHYSRMSVNYTTDHVMYFPGFPWTIRGFRSLLPWIDERAATLLVSNIFSFTALFLVVTYLIKATLTTHLKKAFPNDFKIWLVVSLMAFFPASHFWSSGYAESEQMTAFLLIYILLHEKKWLWAFAVAGIATLIRIQNCWMAAALGAFLAFDFLQPLIKRKKVTERQSSPRIMGLTWRQSALSLVLLIVPFLSFMTWQWIVAGDPFRFIHLMDQGGRKFQFLDLLNLQRPRWDISYICMILSYWAGFRFVRREGLHWKLIGIMSFILALMPLGFGGFGFGYWRYMTCNFGLFILLGELLAERTWIAYPVLGWSIFRLGLEIEGWTLDQWRG